VRGPSTPSPSRRRQLEADPQAVASDLPDLTDWLPATGVRIGEALSVDGDEISLPPLPAPDALAPDWDGWEQGALPLALVNIDWKITQGLGHAGLQRVPTVKTPDSHRTLVLPRFAVRMLWRRNRHGQVTGPAELALSRRGIRSQSVAKDLDLTHP
jgi:hypothetical protein